MNKKIIIPSIIVASAVIIGAGAYGLNSALADSDSDSPPIIQKLVEKFNLNENEVKAVFEEERNQHQERAREMFEERLNQAVKDGKITEEQKNKIMAKHEEMRTERQQERNERQEQRQEMEQWAEDNGINLEDVGMFGGGLGRGGHKGGGWKN